MQSTLNPVHGSNLLGLRAPLLCLPRGAPLADFSSGQHWADRCGRHRAKGRSSCKQKPRQLSSRESRVPGVLPPSTSGGEAPAPIFLRTGTLTGCRRARRLPGADPLSPRCASTERSLPSLPPLQRFSPHPGPGRPHLSQESSLGGRPRKPLLVGLGGQVGGALH